MAVHREAINSEAPGKAGVLLRIDTASAEDVGVHHAAATEFDPASLRTGLTTVAATERARDFELG